MKSNKQKAYHAAFEGPEVKKLKIYGHEWNVKKANIQKEADKVVIEGQISHCMAWSFDDQIFYNFVFDKGKLTKHNVKIEDRNWIELSAPIVSAVGAYIGVPISPDTADKVCNELDKIAYGDWKQAVQGLALDIAMQGYKRMYSIIAYTECDFKGKYQLFPPGVYNNRDFYEVGNDNISSIRVPYMMKVEACSDRPGIGKCRFFTKDQPNVDSLGGISYLCVENRYDPPHILVIDGTKAGRTEYTVEVTEWLSHNAQKGTVQGNDKISRIRDHWKKATGVVEGGKDAYNFMGKLKKVTLTGDKKNVNVTVDGAPFRKYTKPGISATAEEEAKSFHK
ncbi:MAG TPA: hypothetical protein VE868_07405 [Balneolaceae bacterium]|nr:hypothetical protein [Balneolaceae bacterium]